MTEEEFCICYLKRYLSAEKKYKKGYNDYLKKMNTHGYIKQIIDFCFGK